MTNPTLTPTPTPTQAQQVAAWAQIERHLAALDWEPPVTADAIDRLLARMPPRHRDEPLADWLRRGFGLALGETATAAPAAPARIVPLTRRIQGRVRLLGQALAWAAAEAEAAIPSLPGHLDLNTGAVRIEFAHTDGQIQVTLKALGHTLARLKGREVAVTGPEGVTQLLGEVTLGPRGEGRFEVADDPETRLQLRRLQVWEIEPA